MAALRVGNWPELVNLGPTNPADRAAFLGTLLLDESPLMRIAVAIETGTTEHDWYEAATILLEEAQAIARATVTDELIPGSDAYAAIAEELSDPSMTIDDLDEDYVRAAKAWAKRNHKRWPPRPTTSGWTVTIY